MRSAARSEGLGPLTSAKALVRRLDPVLVALRNRRQSRDSSLPEQRTIQAVSSRCSLNVASTCFRQVIGKWQPRRDLNPCHRRERRCPLTEELKTGGWHHCLHVGEIQEQTHRTLRSALSHLGEDFKN